MFLAERPRGPSHYLRHYTLLSYFFSFKCSWMSTYSSLIGWRIFSPSASYIKWEKVIRTSIIKNYVFLSPVEPLQCLLRSPNKMAKQLNPALYRSPKNYALSPGWSSIFNPLTYFSWLPAKTALLLVARKIARQLQLLRQTTEAQQSGQLKPTW